MVLSVYELGNGMSRVEHRYRRIRARGFLTKRLMRGKRGGIVENAVGESEHGLDGLAQSVDS